MTRFTMFGEPKSNDREIPGAAKRVVQEFLGFKGDAALLAPKANLTIASTVWYYYTAPNGETHRFSLFYDLKSREFQLIFTVEGENEVRTLIDVNKDGEITYFNDNLHADSDGVSVLRHDQRFIVERAQTNNPEQYARDEAHRLIEELVTLARRDQRDPFWGNHPKPSGFFR